MEIELLESLFRDHGWCEETCYPELRGRWSPGCPEFGQCAVTSLVVQDILGGDIVKCTHMHHYFNVVGGVVIDLTKSQWGEGESLVCIDRRADRTKMLLGNGSGSAETLRRYLLLKRRTMWAISFKDNTND